MISLYTLRVVCLPFFPRWLCFFSRISTFSCLFYKIDAFPLSAFWLFCFVLIRSFRLNYYYLLCCCRVLVCFCLHITDVIICTCWLQFLSCFCLLLCNALRSFFTLSWLNATILTVSTLLFCGHLILRCLAKIVPKLNLVEKVWRFCWWFSREKYHRLVV